ncbi:MAG: thiol:disulfide interchange protein DsbA/DsbL [Steroidobacteraceae bacterium]
MMNRPIALLVLLASVSLVACARGPAQSAVAAASPAASSDAAPRQGAAAASTSSSAAPASPLASQPGASAASASAANLHDAKDESGASSLERLAALPAKDQLPDGRWKAGVNYDPIVPAQPTIVPRGKVEVLEVFWLGCPHCYALEPYIQKWLKTKPSYIDFVRVPVMWGPVHRLHAKLFYTLEALRRDDLVEKAFDTIHQDNNPLIGTSVQDTFTKQLEWAQTQGIDPKAFTTAYNSFAVNTDLEHAQEITERYHVEGVPMVVVDGKYSTDVGKAGGHEQLIQLIDDLAAFDHRERSHRA